MTEPAAEAAFIAAEAIRKRVHLLACGLRSERGGPIISGDVVAKEGGSLVCLARGRFAASGCQAGTASPNTT